MLAFCRACVVTAAVPVQLGEIRVPEPQPQTRPVSTEYSPTGQVASPAPGKGLSSQLPASGKWVPHWVGEASQLQRPSL